MSVVAKSISQGVFWLLLSSTSIITFSNEAMSQDQEIPDGEGQATDASEPQSPVGYSAPGPGGTVPRKLVPSFRSDCLRASFIAQWMYLELPQGHREFWGTRIVQIDPQSPLRTLGLRAGDVLTRLDGIQVASGMYRQGNEPWQIPELERHYGLTEVRYIVTHTHSVQIGSIDLGAGVITNGSAIEP